MMNTPDAATLLSTLGDVFEIADNASADVRAGVACYAALRDALAAIRRLTAEVLDVEDVEDVEPAA